MLPSGLKKEFLFFDSFEKHAWLTALSSVIDDFDFDSEYEILNEVEEIPGETSFKSFSVITGEPLVFSILPRRPHLALQDA